jgi:hypothetical protein
MASAKANHPDLKRFKNAKVRRDLWNGVLEEAYAYCLPQYERPTSGTPTDMGVKGEKRGYTVYDATGSEAVAEKAAMAQGLLFPPFREWMDFEPTMPSSLDEDQEKKLSEHLEDARVKFHAAIEASNFHTEMAQAMRDSYISTGAITADFGTPENPLDFEALPVGQIVPEESADGVIRTNFREFSVKARDLPVRWPKAKLPEELIRMIKENPDKPVTVVDAEVYDPESRESSYRVFAGKEEAPIFEDSFGSQRTIIFRVDKVPGEIMGRGPALAVMADIKTANKVVELVLKNASIAVTGIWQADDDGVLNPATVKLAPGTIIPKAVGSAGLTPLATPGRFDISQIVLQDLRENIRRAIKGPSLPPADDRVRTAFEIGQREAERQEVETPRTLRLLNELYYPLGRRILQILTHPSMAASPYFIKDLEIV